ncbi:MAG: ABC transporter ATP-binding protein [Betaproteobacteria bacterium]|nr:ABC transporter ATP-binding protein [Betaproteobacteria bacterium]
MQRPVPTLPPHVFAYVWRSTRAHQVTLALLSVLVFALSALPLELQRRIVNDAPHKGTLDTIVWLALAYAGIALLEGAIKLGLNVYRGWVSGNAVRHLETTHRLAAPPASLHPPPEAEGLEVSMVLAEAEPIGLFVGSSVSEPILQGGILLSVFGYMFYIEPLMAAFNLLVFSPQLVFVPLMQRAITRRAGERIRTLREVSGAIVADAGASRRGAARQSARIDHVLELDMGLYKVKFSMNFLMNVVHHLGVASALGVGGWLAVTGHIEVGTVVAFVSGLDKVNDPWGDVVNWYREMTVVATKYRLLVGALATLAGTASGRRLQGQAR